MEKTFSCSWFMQPMRGNVVRTCLIHPLEWEVKKDEAAHKENFTPKGAKIRISSV